MKLYLVIMYQDYDSASYVLGIYDTYDGALLAGTQEQGAKPDSNYDFSIKEMDVNNP